MRRRGRVDDRGAMLVVALIVITTISLVTGAVLTHGRGNLATTVKLREVAASSYAADAAAKLAIDNLRLGSSAPEWTTPGFNGSWNDGSWNGWVYANYSDGTGCFGATGNAPRTSLAYAGVYPAGSSKTADPSARVECTPVAGTGVLGGAGGVVIDDPDETSPFDRALTTLGSSGTYCGTSTSATCSGAYFKVLGKGAGGADLSAPIGGGVASQTRVAVDNGALATDGYVYATAGCTGTIVASDKQCSRSSIPAVSVPVSPLSSVPDVVTTMPTPSGGTCTFQPGSYISGKDLSDATQACTRSVFSPGDYYFDFLDDVPWTMRNRIIGGVLTGGSAATVSIPGACRSPIQYPFTPGPPTGVRFVFGGSSRLSVENGAEVELCAPANADGSAPFAIYQQQTDGVGGEVVTEPPVVTTTTLGPLSAAAVATSPDANNKTDAFVPVPAVRNPDDQSRAAALSASGDSKSMSWTSKKDGNGGDLTLSGIGSLIPANAVLSSAAVDVTYSTAPSAGVSPTFSVGTTSLGAQQQSGRLTLDAAQLAAVQSAITTSGAGGYAPTVKVVIPVSGTGRGALPAAGSTVAIDSISLTYTYTVTTVPPPVIVTLEQATPSIFLQTKSNSTARFVVQGAVYAPDGTVDVDAGQTAFVAFRWGLVANGVSLKTYPQQVFGYPLISIPKPGSGLGRNATVVDLKVFVCVDGGACTSGGFSSLVVRVLITDPDYTDHPTPGRRRMQIVSWAAQR